MENQQFDALTKTMASGKSRRGLLRGAGAGVAASLLGALGLRGAEATVEKDYICHGTGSATNPYVLLYVPIHSAHFEKHLPARRDTAALSRGTGKNKVYYCPPPPKPCPTCPPACEKPCDGTPGCCPCGYICVNKCCVPCSPTKGDTTTNCSAA